MYEDAFGTDWTDLSIGAAIRRMFALGVAAALGEPDREEYERLLGQASSAYDRSVLELSFEEGRQRAAGNRREYATDREAWAALVEDLELPGSDDRDGRLRGTDALPDAIARIGALELDRDDLERLRLPGLLRRD